MDNTSKMLKDLQQTEKSELKNKDINKSNPKTKKQEESQKRYMNKVITRKESLEQTRDLLNDFSKNTISHANNLFEALRHPLNSSLVQTMAVTELLKAKGIIESDDELQEYIDKVAEKLSSMSEDGSNNDKENQEESDRES